MSGAELFNWARGPGLQIAVAIFLLGTLVRILEMWMLGRKVDLSEARGEPNKAGWRTVWSRFKPAPGITKQAPVVVIGGYIFHIALFVSLLFFVPHILLFKEVFGFSWPGLPNFLVDALTVAGIIALFVLLGHRLVHPVRRYLSNFWDYWTWFVTLAPLLTGYLAYHRMVLPYQEMLALHVISVELLLITIPFTKLIHAVTFVFARYYNGAFTGRKGVQA